jgi:hypothetical protein
MKQYFLALLFLTSLLAGCIAEDSTTETSDKLPGENEPNPSPELPAIEVHVEPSHHSIEFQIRNSTGPAILQVTGQAPISINETATIGFLTPDTIYDWTIQSNETILSGSSTTTTNPYKWAAPSDALITPGTWISTCTLAWIFTDATNETLYAMTAGHCGEVGSEKIAITEHDNGPTELPTQTTTKFGVTRYAIDEDEGADFAFIEIYPEARSLVNPQLLHWTGPTGVKDPSQLQSGEPLCLYGHSGTYGTTNETRPRCGSHAGEAGNYTYAAYGLAGGGDSGAPIINPETGEAVGIAVRVLVPPVVVFYTTVCHALDWLMDEHGLELRLATAPSNAPPYPTIPISPPYALSTPQPIPCGI